MYRVIEKDKPRLHLYIGPMWSGKTTKIIQETSFYQLSGYKCVFVKHETDNRYGIKEIIAHNGFLNINIYNFFFFPPHPPLLNNILRVMCLFFFS